MEKTKAEAKKAIEKVINSYLFEPITDTTRMLIESDCNRALKKLGIYEKVYIDIHGAIIDYTIR